MRVKSGLRTLLPALALACCDPVAAEPIRPIEFVKVADGVYAAVRPEKLRFVDGNAAVVVTDDGVMIVDTHVRPATARVLGKNLSEITDKFVRWVVNTHWHQDHIQGNQVYDELYPGLVSFISADSTREDIEKRAIPQAEEEKRDLPVKIDDMRRLLEKGTDENGADLSEDARNRLVTRIGYYKGYLDDLTGLRFVLPTITFNDRLSVRAGGIDIQLMRFRAHSRGDVVAYLPRERVLITGDLLDECPYLGQGYPKEWIQALQALEALGFDTIIPGHGRPMQGKEHLQLVKAMLQSLVDQARIAATKGMTIEQARSTISLAAFRDRMTKGDPLAQQMFDGNFPDAIDRAYLEARGELKD